MMHDPGPLSRTLTIPGDPYPDRIRQILVKMPRANAANLDKMGPKCLKSQIDDADRSSIKYSARVLSGQYQHAQFFFFKSLNFESPVTYRTSSYRLIVTKDLVLRTNFHSSFCSISIKFNARYLYNWLRIFIYRVSEKKQLRRHSSFAIIRATGFCCAVTCPSMRHATPDRRAVPLF
jgi:hypothetical protein